MPQLRKSGNEVAATYGDGVSVPPHLLSPATRETLSLKLSIERPRLIQLLVIVNYVRYERSRMCRQ